MKARDVRILLDFLGRRHPVTSEEVARRHGISRRTARRYLRSWYEGGAAHPRGYRGRSLTWAPEKSRDAMSHRKTSAEQALPDAHPECGCSLAEVTE